MPVLTSQGRVRRFSRKLRMDIAAIRVALKHPYRLQVAGDDHSLIEIAEAVAPRRADVDAVFDSHETVLTVHDRLRFERAATR